MRSPSGPHGPLLLPSSPDSTYTTHSAIFLRLTRLLPCVGGVLLSLSKVGIAIVYYT